MSIADDATFWVERGYYPIPIPYREKGPKLEGWQNLHLTAADVPRYFNGAPQNIGVLLGAPYGNCDIDLDCQQALVAWPHFAPETGLIFGHASKPASHWEYRIDPPWRSKKYLDPVDGVTLLEFRCLKSDGSVGLQTVVPPSVHPSGERIEFWRGCSKEPANVDKEELGRAVVWTACVAMLARHWPQAGGGRHDAFLALAGALAYARWGLNEAAHFVAGLYQTLWPGSADLSAAMREVESTFQGYDDGHAVTGLPHLAKLVPPLAVKQLAKWLTLRQEPETREKPVFAVRSLPSIWSFEQAQIEWIIEGLIAAGTVNLITGDSGVGKSTLMLELAGAIAHGKPFLGRPALRRPVLYVDRENPLFVVKERLLRLHIPETRDLIVWGTWNDPWPEGPVSPSIVQFAAAEKPVIVFDALIGFHQSDEQSASEMRRHMQGYRMLAANGATPVILHNTGKSETAKWFRGSSDIKASIDAAYLLESTAGAEPGTGLEGLRLVPFKTRLAPPSAIHIRYTNGGFESVEPHKPSEWEILETILRLHPNISGRELLRLTASDLPQRRVLELLLEGIQKERIEAVGTARGRGGKRYRLRVDGDGE